MAKSTINLAAALALSVGMSAAVYTAPVDAAGKGKGKGKGPQAGLSTLVTCALNTKGTAMDVTVTLTNDSGDDAVVVDVSSSLQAVYKDRTTKGKQTKAFGTGQDVNANNLGAGASISTTKTVELCGLPSNVTSVNAELTGTYNADGSTDTRNISDSCGDDPGTDAAEPEGFDIDYAALQEACTL